MMEKQDTIAQDIQQAAFSREELEQYLRTRAWKDDAFRQELLANPKAVLQHECAAWFPEGKIPSELTIKVVEEEEQGICLVLPPKAPDALPNIEAIEDEELSTISGANTVDAGTCWSCDTCYGCSRGTCHRCNSALKVYRIKL